MPGAPSRVCALGLSCQAKHNKLVAITVIIKLRWQLMLTTRPGSVRAPSLELSVAGAQAALFSTWRHAHGQVPQLFHSREAGGGVSVQAADLRAHPL